MIYMIMKISGNIRLNSDDVDNFIDFLENAEIIEFDYSADKKRIKFKVEDEKKLSIIETYIKNNFEKNAEWEVFNSDNDELYIGQFSIKTKKVQKTYRMALFNTEEYMF